MDLHTVTRYRPARDRADLALAAGERVLAGGTWLFSEPQPGCTGLVDLTTMGWPALSVLPGGGLQVAATCPIAELAELTPQPGWRATPLFRQCADALLASFKIHAVATVGGNICRGFAAAAMTSLCAALDGVATVWMPDGSSYEQPVATLATGNGTTSLRPGEVVRSVVRTTPTTSAYAQMGRCWSPS